MATRDFVSHAAHWPLTGAVTSSLIELQRPEIVEVNDPLDPAAGSDDDERGDLLLLHEGEG